MVIGIDALINAIHKETERYRDARKEEKRQIKTAFISIKAVLNTAILKIELCKEYGHYKPSKLQWCIPNIALEIDRVAIETKDILDINIYNGFTIMTKCLVDFNEKINSLSLGVSIREDIKDILKTLNDLKTNVEKIEKIK